MDNQVAPSEPWWVRHQRLKDELGPRARAEAQRRTRRIDERCFNLAGEMRICPRLPARFSRGVLVVTRPTCRVKRCPREEP